jgi:uncharacterized 2Fe-2S/4Fe-4S cluster protein (DUF4445 family)
MATVRFVNQALNIDVPEGSTILDAARSAGVEIEAPCNAVGTCGKCRVKLADAARLNCIKHGGEHRLSEKETEEGWLLACQAKVLGDIDVIHEDKKDENKNLRILAEGESFSYELAPFITRAAGTVYGGGAALGTDAGGKPEDSYGIAVDIGTTTIVAELIHLPTGRRLASESMLNPQSAYAQDVLTRIHFATEEENGLETLYKAFLSAFSELRDGLIEAAGVSADNVYEVIYSGNTTMLHLATGADPASLGKYPYNYNIKDGSHVSAADLGISPFGLVYLPPVISSFVGADIVSGILAAQLHKKTGVTLFIDVGTNGEMVLANGGRIAATSTAAGPAFEGMNISCGMRAAPGAIEQFVTDEANGISFKTIGGAEAAGICGSGLLDIVGELARTGVVGKSGRFVKPENAEISGELKSKFRGHNGKPAFFITDGVFITQQDIRQVQLAKGAIRAGITALLGKLEIAERQVDEVLIAGSFGYHLRESSLINMAMLPGSFTGKVRFVGNTSQTGAVAFLLNRDLRGEMKELARKVDKIELADTPGFEKIFIASLGF